MEGDETFQDVKELIDGKVELPVAAPGTVLEPYMLV